MVYWFNKHYVALRLITIEAEKQDEKMSFLESLGFKPIPENWITKRNRKSGGQVYKKMIEREVSDKV